MGWQYDSYAGRWELADGRGRVIRAVADGQVAVAGRLGALNRVCAAKGWPLLGRKPWWHCVMVGGPMDGTHEWFDPEVHDGPPEALMFGDEPLPGMPPGGPLPDEASVRVTYRRGERDCQCEQGGAWCPWPYRTAGPAAPLPAGEPDA